MNSLKGVFALFPGVKMVRGLSALGVGTVCGLYFVHAGFFIDEDGGVWMRLPSGRWTLRGSDEQVFWVLGSWRATCGALDSSWLLEVSVLLASASFWSTLLLRGYEAAAVEG